MHINDAADICRPLGQRGPQDETLALADRLIGEESLRNAKLEEEAGVSSAYRAASKALETLSINLHAYCRGMVGKQVVPSYLDQAQEAINAMRAAL